MNTRSARVVRGLSAAFFAVFVAAFSHVAGGGAAPGGVGLVLALAFSSVVCVGLAGRSLSIIRLAASVVVSQGLLHTLFGVGADSGAGSVFEQNGSGHHAGMVLVNSASSGAGVGAPGDWLAAQVCSGMWVAHAVAALVTVLALRHGERALQGLLRLARLRLRRLVRVLGAVPVAALRTAPGGSVLEPDHLRDLGVFLGGLRHRGPPLCVRSAN